MSLASQARPTYCHSGSGFVLCSPVKNKTSEFVLVFWVSLNSDENSILSGIVRHESSPKEKTLNPIILPKWISAGFERWFRQGNELLTDLQFRFSAIEDIAELQALLVHFLCCKPYHTVLKVHRRHHFYQFFTRYFSPIRKTVKKEWPIALRKRASTQLSCGTRWVQNSSHFQVRSITLLCTLTLNINMAFRSATGSCGVNTLY